MTQLPSTEPSEPEDTADDELDDPWHDQIAEAQESYGGPEVLAVVAFVMAVASFLGFGLMTGTTYVAPLLSQGADDNSTRVVIGILVGAALAMIPVWLGWRASSRALDSDPKWVLPIARAAIILGLLAGALRLVVAVLSAAQDGSVGFTRL